jgi:hypothetical protein
MALTGGIGLAASIPTPPALGAGVASPAVTAVLLDAANEYCGMVLRAPKAGTIKKVLFLTGTVTTGATLDVTIEGVSATTGGPDGTPLTDGTTTCVVADPDDDVQKTATFATGPTVTEGQLIAVKIANPAASAGTLNINANTSSLASVYLPYSFTALTALSKVRNAPLIGLEYSDGSYAFHPNVLPVLSFTSETFNSGTTPDEIGLKFSLPFPYRVRGVWWIATQIGSSSVVVTLYDSDGSTVLESVTVDTEQVQTTSAGLKYLYFTAKYDLDASTSYRATLTNSSGSNVTFGGFEISAAAQMDAFECGQNFHRTERTDSGAWTDTTTKRPWMGLLVSAFDDGASVGGGTTIAGTPMRRGMV